MIYDLKHKIALVTGSGKKTGIGYGIVHQLATCGANVILADLAAKEIRPNELAAADLDEMTSVTMPGPFLECPMRFTPMMRMRG
ncbi:MAG: hypothetical protein P8X68_12430 [Desulfobacterales bacterium]